MIDVELLKRTISYIHEKAIPDLHVKELDNLIKYMEEDSYTHNNSLLTSDDIVYFLKEVLKNKLKDNE